MVQISLCQFLTFRHCKLQQFEKKPRLLKTQVIKNDLGLVRFFWTCLSERQFNVFSSQNVERLGDFDLLQELPAPAACGSSSPTWLHICSLPASAALIFKPKQEPHGSHGPFCPFQGSASHFLVSCPYFSLLPAAQGRAAIGCQVLLAMRVLTLGEEEEDGAVWLL